MKSDRIRIAINAGRRWAEQEIESGSNITPSSARAAAETKFEHLGSRELFCRSALDTALLKGAVEFEDDPARVQEAER